eukprot:1054138_1
MIIELDTKKSRDNVIYCAVLTLLNFFLCDDWQYWHIVFRFIWVSLISGLFQFKYLPVVLKSITIIRAVALVYLFGIVCIFKILFFVHQDIHTIITSNTSPEFAPHHNIILDILLIDLQCAYMQTLCAAVWMFVKLSKHFGYANEWKHVLKTIIPHSLTLFIVSGCPAMNVKYWWLSLGLYRSFIAITQLIFDTGFTSFFDTKDGKIGIKNTALTPHAITSKLSMYTELTLNILSLARHSYFAVLVAPWVMVPLLCANIYGMCRNLLQEGRKHLQLTLKL